MFMLWGKKVHSFHTLVDLTIRLLNTITSNSILSSERYVIKANIDFAIMRQKICVTSQLLGLQNQHWKAPHTFFHDEWRAWQIFRLYLWRISYFSIVSWISWNGLLMSEWTWDSFTEACGSNRGTWKSVNVLITLHFPDPTFGKNSECVVNRLINAL